MGGRGEEGGGKREGGRGRGEEGRGKGKGGKRGRGVMEDERKLADWKPVRVSVILHPIAIIIKSSLCALSLL